MGKRKDEDIDDVEDVNNEEANQEEAELDYDAEFDSIWGAQDASHEEPTEEDSDEEVEEDEDLEEVDGDEEDEVGHSDPEVPDKPEKKKSEDPYAWINKLPAEVRAQAEALKHSAMSDHGRVAAFNRQLQDLKAELEEYKRSSRSQASVDQPAKKQAESTAPELPKEVEQLAEDFPEFAAALKAVHAADGAQYTEKVEELKAMVQPLLEERQKSLRREFEQAVEEGAKEIFQDDGWDWRDVSRSEDFRAWLGMQPKSMKLAAQAPDPAEALLVLRSYKRDYDAEVQKLLEAEAATQSTSQENSGKKPSSKADEVKARRTLRKKTSTSPGSKPVATDPQRISGDYEDEFNRLWG